MPSCPTPAPCSVPRAAAPIPPTWKPHPSRGSRNCPPRTLGTPSFSPPVALKCTGTLGALRADVPSLPWVSPPALTLHHPSPLTHTRPPLLACFSYTAWGGGGRQLLHYSFTLLHRLKDEPPGRVPLPREKGRLTRQGRFTGLLSWFTAALEEALEPSVSGFRIPVRRFNQPIAAIY